MTTALNVYKKMSLKSGRSDVDFRRKKSNQYCLEGAERRKCSRSNAYKCPIFVKMEEDGGEWPVV
jgi:hypothetical protein